MSRHLIVGAGASYAEAEAAGLPENLRPPLISNFALKMWDDYNPAIVLSAYLESCGEHSSGDPRCHFFELERNKPTEYNIERFFEFAWQAKDRYPGEWENLLLHGILNPLILMFSRGLWKDGITDAALKLSPSVAAELIAGDVVLDLNYDTLFEIGAFQSGHELTFVPNTPTDRSLLIAKPHGSVNLVVNTEKRSFRFGTLDWPGTPQPADGSANFLGFIPPRQNKNYSEHPIAKMILQPLLSMRPHAVTFWGVGFTNSDVDLVAVYAAWCQSVKTIEVINPDQRVADLISRNFGRAVVHFDTVANWKERVRP